MGRKDKKKRSESNIRARDRGFRLLCGVEVRYLCISKPLDPTLLKTWNLKVGAMI